MVLQQFRWLFSSGNTQLADKMWTVWRLSKPRILLHFQRKRQVVPWQRTVSPPRLTSNAQQWHLLSSPSTGSSFFSLRDWNGECRLMQQVGGSLMLDGGKPWYRLFRHGLVWELSTRMTEGKLKKKKKSVIRPKKRTPVAWSLLEAFLLNSQWRLNVTAFSCPVSQLAAPQHTAILFSFSTTTGVDSAWCGRQGHGDGLRGGASKQFFNSSRCFTLGNTS